MSANAVIYKFGSFRLDPVRRLLSSKGKLIAIPPKPLELLLVLVEQHGQIVSKEELIKLVWPNAFVEEANISQNIFLLRKVLGTDDESHQYIETVPRRGYRFVGKVREEMERSVEAADKRSGPEATSSKDLQVTELADRFTCSIAVLPITNLGADPDVEYLCDGITETIINRIAHVSYLRVIARPTVFRFKGRETQVQEVARELNVENVATGRILARGDDLNIQIELTNTPYESQFWGKQYESRMTDILEIQGRIAQDVLEQLKIQCTSEERERITGRPTNNTEVYQLYLKGCYHENQFTEDGLKKAFEYFQQAIQKEPGFALGYTGLAECYALSGLSLDPEFSFGYPDFVDNDTLAASGPNEAMTKANAAAMKALKLDDMLAEAHAALGFIKYRFDWDWPAAESEYRRAIELSPNYAKAHYWLSMCLRTMGRLDEALAEAKMAHELDPLMLIITVELGRTYYFARFYDLAIKHYREVLDFEPNFLPAHFRLGQAYIQLAMYEEAIDEFQLAMPPSGNDPDVMAALAFVYAITGRTTEAREMLDQLKALSLQRHVSAYSLALVYIGLDDKDKALMWLRNAYEDRSVWLIGINVDPMLDRLRPDPRFTELVQRVGVAA